MIDRSDRDPWASLPAEIRELTCWLPWVARRRANSKVAKIPVRRLGRSLYPVRPTDPDAWLTHQAALDEVTTGRASGIGVCLPTGMCVLDVDDVLINGRPSPEMRALVDDAASWTELSPSGQGLHLWFCAPQGLRPTRSDGLELLTCGQYVTVTGMPLPGSGCDLQPLPPALQERFAERRPVFPPRSVPVQAIDGDDAVARHLQSAIERQPRFRQLFRDGDTSAYDSHSEADLALCQMLRRLVGPDLDMIDLWFRRSALVRAKWLDDGYRERTIALTLRSGWTGSPPRNSDSA
ncbi:bifunctional DNA primase/polymerase [Deinococcus sonorensis]|uniref:DNA primase/polymerase bifunctional N-terminal domain-containing protein n=2 Tax=Deinococcus sonorensis TaxID=309891 RepID=A0AAU7UHT3_9DEIO